MRTNSALSAGFSYISSIQGGGLNAGKSISPNAKICECCKDGSEITVLLQREVEIDEGGTPVQSTWAMEAFGHSEEAQRKLKAAVKDDPDHPLNQEEPTASMFLTEAVQENKDEGEAKENPEEDKEADAKAEDKGGSESKQEESKNGGESKAESKKGGESFHVSSSASVGPVVTVNE